MTVPRVLIVDDDAQIVVSVVRLLAHSGLDVVTETSAARALDVLDASPFDLLVVDLRMPGISGVEMLRIAERRWPNMRRALLTGALADEYNALADEIFIKGSEPQVIVDRVCHLAKYHRVIE